MGFWQSIVKYMNEYIDFSSNINFVKPHINIDLNTLEISSYSNYEKLYDNIAKLYGVKKSEIELFNGRSSAIFSLFRHLQLKECFIYAPISLEYKKTAQLFGYKTTIINRFLDINEPIKENSLIIFESVITPQPLSFNLGSISSALVSASFIF